ncbi:hypothetical protein H1R20_g13645, partial [Candolleomyces eurysporus]
MANTVPPRYAIESDEEEDEINPLRKRATSKGQAPSEITLKLVGDVLQNKPLVIASARAGAFWAKGATLGEQTGAVYVNQIQSLAARHLLFPNLLLFAPHPPHRRSHSIPFHRGFADAQRSNPTILAPQTSSNPPRPHCSSNSASPTSPSTLLLLPSPHLPIPPPKDLSPTNIPSSTSPEYEDTWPAEAMNIATDQLLSFIEVKPDEGFTWELNSKDAAAIVPPHKRRSEIGEGGMYL